MEINFKSVKLAKVFNQEKMLMIEYGEENGRIIMRRMQVLLAAQNLSQVAHLRLVFRPNHDPVPLKTDGGIDLEHITSITIMSVEDYH